MSRINGRITQLEKHSTPDEKMNWSVDWAPPGFMTDPETGEEIPEAEFMKKYPDVIIVTWDDVD